MAKKFDNVDDFVNSITTLPALPSNIQKINELLNDEKTSADDISKVVASDQALATKMLRTANSAYYGRLSKVVKIQDAVVLIGMTNLKSMLYSIFVNQMYGGSKRTDQLMIDLWMHSVSVALMGRKLVEKSNPALKDETYTAGLLHDIGELILFTYEKNSYLEVLGEIAIDDIMSRTVIEESMLGFSHADLGAILARKWNLPRVIKNAIFYHHNIDECDTEEDHQLVAAVHVADTLCLYGKVGGTDKLGTGKTIMEAVSADAVSRLGLDEGKMNAYLKEMGDIISEAKTFVESLKDK